MLNQGRKAFPRTQPQAFINYRSECGHGNVARGSHRLSKSASILPVSHWQHRIHTFGIQKYSGDDSSAIECQGVRVGKHIPQLIIMVCFF